MERRLSLSNAFAGFHGQRSRLSRPREAEQTFGSSVINFPGNPRFRPQAAFKMAYTSPEMEDRRVMLTNHAVIVKEEEPLGLRSTEELKDVIFHHFGICKHELYVYRSHPNPFIVIFPEMHDRDVVLAAGKIIEGPAIELRFHAWDLDEFGDRTSIPYHINLSI
jgi:hypothetical protein